MRDIAGDCYVWISLHINVIFERDELDKVRVEKLLIHECLLTYLINVSYEGIIRDFKV